MKKATTLLVGTTVLMIALGGCALFDSDGNFSVPVHNTEKKTPPSSNQIAGFDGVSANTTPLTAGTPLLITKRKARNCSTIEAGYRGKKYPWFAKKANMTLVEFAEALQNGDKKKLRVGWQDYAKDLRCLGFNVGSSSESLKKFLFSGDIKVVKCTSGILAKHNMAWSNKDGSKRAYTYHRKRCYVGEQLLLEKSTGRYILSLGCGNILASIKVDEEEDDNKESPPVGKTPTIICKNCK